MKIINKNEDTEKHLLDTPILYYCLQIKKKEAILERLRSQRPSKPNS